jgi:hypothetical protein
VRLWWAEVLCCNLVNVILCKRVSKLSRCVDLTAAVFSCSASRLPLSRATAGTNNAVFLDSCHHHCGEWNAITIEGITCSQAVTLWYNGGVKALPSGSGIMDADQPYPCPNGTPGCCPK